MLSSRTVLLASAAAAACLVVNLEAATAQLVSACYADSNFPGAPQPVANEAECRKQCADSVFAAIQVRLVGTAVNGLCRCGDLPPVGVQSGVCATQCSTGGNCGGTGVEAILDIAAGAAAAQPPTVPLQPLARPNSTVPALVAPNGTAPGLPAPPVTTPTPTRQPRRPVLPTTAPAPPGTVTKQVRQAPTESSGGLPASLLITGGTILGAILLVPFVVVSCLRYQRRRVNATKPDTPYNSTAKRLRPVSSTMFLDEPPPFPEMRASPGSIISPVSAPYRPRPNYGQPPSPTSMSIGPSGMGGYIVPPNTYSVYSRTDSEASSSFSSQGSQRLPDGYIPAPQPLAFNYNSPQAPMAGSTPMLGGNYGSYDEVSPNGGGQSQVYIGAGNSLSVVPQLAFDVDYGNFDGVVPPSDRAPASYIATPEQEDAGHSAPP